MKQRTRLMHSGDDLLGPTMSYKKNEDNAEIQLHQVKPQEHFIEAQIQEGDTLQAIALRFYCSISELKRINHIHKDNEIFARRIIKVPVTPYSVLTELIPATQPDPLPSTSKQSPTNNGSHSSHINGLPNSLSINSDPTETNDFSIDCNTVVMNSTLTPSLVPYTDNETNEAISEDTSLLPNKSKERISVETVVVKELTSHGADFGLKWYHLVCLMLILVVVIPLVYVMFYLDKHEHSELPPLYSS